MTGSMLRNAPAPFPDVPWPAGKAFPAAAHLNLRLKTFRHVLRTLVRRKPGATLVDLGAGTGQFARIASRLGYAVTAVDARARWTVDGEAAGDKQPPTHDPIRWIRADLRSLHDLAMFDVVLAVGVLYHLPLADQLSLLRRTAGRPLVIDTELFDAASIPRDRAWRFRQVISQEGYGGATCQETGHAWSSAGDAESFWFTEASILDAFRDSGRTEVTVLDPAYRSAFGPRRWYVLHG
jgi:SAM-dependent methyltransferase